MIPDPGGSLQALAVETASFDLRFGGQIVRDRYLFYVVPLLLAGTAAALQARRMRQVVVGTAAMTVFFAVTVHWLDFPTSTSFWVDSPERILNSTLADQAGSLTTAGFVAFAGGLLGLTLIAALVVVPRPILGVAPANRSTTTAQSTSFVARRQALHLAVTTAPRDIPAHWRSSGCSRLSVRSCDTPMLG
jgi:hypothetical protein